MADNAPPTHSSGAASAVYATLEQAQKLNQGAAVPQPLPAFELYKVAREEELLAFRSICRVFTMHYGSQQRTNSTMEQHASSSRNDNNNNNNDNHHAAFPKAVQRLLDDLQESFCISQDRAALEKSLAAADEVVQGVYQSGILRRREDFFDGVEDIDVSPLLSADVEDDKGTLYTVGVKRQRTGQVTGGNSAVSYPLPPPGVANSGAGSGHPLKSARKNPHLTQQITRIQHDVKNAAKNFLYSRASNVVETSLQVLREKKEELLALQEKLLQDGF